MRQQTEGFRPANLLRWLLPLLVTAAAVYFVGRQIDFAQVDSAFSRVSLQNLLLVLALFILCLLLRVVCWFFLLEGKFSFSETFFGMNAGYLLNNVLPLKLGEFGRAALLAGRGKTGFLPVFASIVTERVLDFFLAAFFFLVSLPLVVTNTSVKSLAVVILILTVVGMLAAAFAARHKERISGFLRARWAGKPRLLALLPRGLSFLEGFQILLRPGRFFAALLLLAASWASAMLEVWVLAKALIPQSQWWWGIFVTSGSAFANALPTAPASMGVYEAANVAAFSVLGVDQSTALVIALILHAVQFLITSLLGMLGIYLLGDSLGKLSKKAMLWKQQQKDTE
ncbi:MAG: flippase-like domain-containing protein [Chloroflexi bacterium]|nr:flippase-like domain-containing protein [Anaerolineaceae bacterium]NLI44127.1 flippase-like domain-containing protein [Chloroflexota bacterium]HOE34632.1 lysylphosphatidylglycerol synthase transmembrane domain-containing protein [Anaerolineaceae bacterium]HOT24844.1 lysylphosphatidylglycerol synthase transmembrane domain-containing protein [Anaerolineaceae bacterium]HQH57613.1 lysylphosphatidylglycerol synthase transmembrane domain-containing protein [Anaerolineaceae bacterium]